MLEDWLPRDGGQVQNAHRNRRAPKLRDWLESLKKAVVTGKNRPFPARLRFAVTGIVAVARHERSFRSQALLALAALAVASVMRPPIFWWSVIVLSIGFVLALECLNGALEYALDRLHPEQHPEIGRAKDAAAGAVLIASATAACVGALMVAACW
jgi:undecaprenol kinase